MRPPRLILLVFFLIFLPILLTFFSALSSSSRVATPNAIAGPTSGLHALFSFNIPSSLFPPSAIISLTDDNSTFFLARPAAFGPLLAEKGRSGQLWVGSGFGEGGPAPGATGELGCSDIPGWRDGDTHRQDKSSPGLEKTAGKPGSSGSGHTTSQNSRRTDSQHDSDSRNVRDQHTSPSTKDGTDDHLHHPLPESSSEKRSESGQIRQVAHADIQSMQESAEISGKVVLLSRGGCGFLEKAKWVQRRGGSALIVGDDTRGGGLITMYARGDTSNITIPSLFTSHTTAQLLSSLVPRQSGEDSSLSNGYKGSSRTKPSGQSSLVIQGSTSSSSVPIPTATPASMTDEPIQGASKPKAGMFHTLLSFLGLGSGDGRTWHLPEDSRRPPGSGNIDWVVLDSWDEEETSLDGVKGSTGRSHSRPQPSSIFGGSKKSESQKTSVDGGDGFVIGVQDWRDPDVISPKGSATPSPTRTLDSRVNENSPSYAPTSLRGGSRTPGSGEYRDIEVNSENSRPENHHSMAAAAQSAPPTSGKNWFSRHFTWADAGELDVDQSPASRDKGHAGSAKVRGASSSPDNRIINSEDHEGLWVTLTPTSMSTSPFFDTLLVLVVSPLVTLTVVYALLLLRGRIRRRRWRAPKSVVERLPVRTYHTITSSSSSSSAGSVRSGSPGSALPTSPLLGSRSSVSPTRPRSQTMSGVFAGAAGPSNVELPNKEKSSSRTSRWQRKYTGRQVECVVCLEEYVDGQSRVMSLPCGHEFHAECM